MLQLDIDKYEFNVYETKYLGLTIQSAFLNGHSGCLKMCPDKVSIMDSWRSSQKIKDV